MSRQENLLDKLAKAYDQWENLQKQGGSDPFYPDGVNLNLVRNHILYYKQRIEEEQPLYKTPRCFSESCLPRWRTATWPGQRKSAVMPRTPLPLILPTPTANT